MYANPYTALHRVPALILICLFAFCLFATVSYGIRCYQVIHDGAEWNFTVRTGLNYIATRLRQAQIAQVSIPDPHTLLLAEEIGGRQYATRVYIGEGMLIESFGRYEPGAASFDTRIAAATGFTPEFIASDLLKITLADAKGEEHSIVVYAPWGEGER